MRRAWQHLVRARWAWIVGMIGGLGTVAGALASVLQIVPSPADLTPVLWIQLRAFANEQVLAATAAFEKRFTDLDHSLADVNDHLAAVDVDRMRAQLAGLRATRPQLDALRAANPQSDLLVMQLAQLDASIAELSGQLVKAKCALDQRTTSPWLVC